MAEQRLKHCSVLVIDDSAPSRTLVATALHDIGVGSVNTVPHGAAAIEYLQHSVLAAMNGPTPPVDLIISEWDMNPVGGMMLMQWLRHSPASPDRFLRAVIMSGALDVEKVEQARAAGVNAVFSKPFTINSLRKHLLSVVENNPLFFKTLTYFGPDRRRRCVDVTLHERRKTAQLQDEVLGAGENPQVGCFDLPNSLADILDGVPRAQIDDRARAVAHQKLAAYQEDYADWVARDIAMIRFAFRTANESETNRQRILSHMHPIVVRLEREAAYMDYPLISALAHTLKTALKTDLRLWRDTAEIYSAAIQGLEAVVREHISGHGGALGGALGETLSNMDQKLLRLTPVRATPPRARRSA